MTPVEEIRRAAQLMREPDDIPAHISAWRRKEMQLAVADVFSLTARQWDHLSTPLRETVLIAARAYLGGAP